jgi:hypothetical protein
MAGQDVIREFLVSLGYEVDDQSERKFNNSLRGAVVQANLLADAITGMARFVVEGIEKVARSFDSLYWTSQRTGASVENIRALSYAVSQLGGTYEGARASIEAFGAHLRSNPGYASLLRTLGVSTEQNGHMRDQVEILEDLGKALSRKPYAQAVQYANALGIDEQTMRALMSGDLQKNIGKYSELQKSLGFDNEKAAAASKDFMNAMREVQATIETVVAKILTDLEPAITKVMKEFANWVVEHGSQIENALKQIAAVVETLATDFGTLVDKLSPVWKGFDQLTQSIAGKDGLTAAIEFLVGAYVLGKLVRMLAVLGTSASGLAVLAAIIGMTAPTNFEQSKANGNAASSWLDGTWFGKTYNKVGNSVRGWFGMSKMDGSPQGGNSVPEAGQNANALESYKFWRQKGLSHDAALGMVANEEGESGFNPHSVGDGGSAGGSFQWHKTRRDQILAGTGIDVWSSKSSHSDMLRAAHWEMTQGPDSQARQAWEAFKNVATPAEGAAVGVKYYERPLDQQGDAYKRGVMANRWASRIPANTDFSVSPLGGGPNSVPAGANISQSTHINVVGATDPQATASAIEKKQSLVNMQMQRNMQGAVR